ncbi:MAG: hypothetical protein KC431_20880, partial [Myxococcales bacterium]|nr:hypothetical protein [Myxococcales bacterium]
DGQRLWSLRLEALDQSQLDEPAAGQAPAPSPSLAALAEPLAALNRAQLDHDRAALRLEGLREQLYLDWCKFARCRTPSPGVELLPDGDAVGWTIEHHWLPQVEAAAGALGLLTVNVGDGETPTTLAAAGDPDSLAAGVAAAHQAVHAAIAELLPSLDGHRVEVEILPGPRYWEPRDPVIAVSGAPCSASRRHGVDDRHSSDGRLPCFLEPHAEGSALTLPGDEALAAGDGQLLGQALIASFTAARGKTELGVHRAIAERPNPVLLAWRVSVSSVSHGSNLETADGRYAPDHLTATHTFTDDGVYRLREGATLRSGEGDAYVGQVLLTDGPAETLRQRLRHHLVMAWSRATTLAQPLLDDWRDADAPLAVEQAFAAIWRAVEGDAAATLDEPVAALYRRLWRSDAGEAGLGVLCQSLGGFNIGCLMSNEGRQLSLEMPLG